MSVFELADDCCEILVVCWSTITEIPKWGLWIHQSSHFPQKTTKLSFITDLPSLRPSSNTCVIHNNGNPIAVTPTVRLPTWRRTLWRYGVCSSRWAWRSTQKQTHSTWTPQRPVLTRFSSRYSREYTIARPGLAGTAQIRYDIYIHYVTDHCRDYSANDVG